MTEFIIILFAVTMLYVASTSRIEAYIRAIAAQGILLFALVMFDYDTIDIANLLFLSVETIIVKAVIIPVFLINIVRKSGILREVEPNIPNFFSLIIMSFIFILGFVLSYESISFALRPLYFGVSASTIAGGLFLIISRKKIITHVMGYMFLENGIFLLALSIAKEMPFIVALGVLLDIFIAVYLFGLFFTRVNYTFSEVDIDKLSELKD